MTANNEKRFRVFLALEPPRAILEELGRLQERIKKAYSLHCRWTGMSGMHLTVKFFGDVSPSALPAIAGIARESTKRIPPMRLEARTLGVFPALRRARVLWIGLQGDVAALISLQAELERGFADLGYKGEGRSFRPHLTLGRLKSPDAPGELAKIIADHRDTGAGAFSPEGLTLFKSDLTPAGALYARLDWFPFAETAGSVHKDKSGAAHFPDPI